MGAHVLADEERRAAELGSVERDIGGGDAVLVDTAAQMLRPKGGLSSLLPMPAGDGVDLRVARRL